MRARQRKRASREATIARHPSSFAAASDRRIDPAAPLPQVLIGDAPYYERFGFAEAPRGWTCPGPWDPARLLARDLPGDFPAEGMLGPWPARGLAN